MRTEIKNKSQHRLGQFMTPPKIAEFMASLFSHVGNSVDFLDPGAGGGALSKAFANRFFSLHEKSSQLKLTAYEIDKNLASVMNVELSNIKTQKRRGRFDYEVHNVDFIRDTTFDVAFAAPAKYTHVLLNPPYRKMNTDSEYRHLLSMVGVETVNLYTAFLALAIAQTRETGELVAIIPRSFCNGAYFRPFRKWMLERVSIQHMHVFDSRHKPFHKDDVLQENIIIHLARGNKQKEVIISRSEDGSFSDYSERKVPFREIVMASDTEKFIHIPTAPVNDGWRYFQISLQDLGIEVSTGPVVDFRVREYCLEWPVGRCAPLIYPHHFRGGTFEWPRKHKKPNALVINDDTTKWLMPRGHYCITKRFSSKEERRRVVAYAFEPSELAESVYGFENHLNVFHTAKNGLDPDIARGLSVFLNSTVVDDYFRSFSGHTQINATDLRRMCYPNEKDLIRFGRWLRRTGNPSQVEIDQFLER